MGDDARFEQFKEEFLSSVGHELRTPLTTMQGTIKLLQSGLLDATSDKGRRMLDLAASNGDRLQKLVDGLMDVNRIRCGRMVLHKEQCDTLSLAREAFARVADRLGARSVKSAVQAGRVWVDPGRIVDVLEKLLDNAIRFSPDGTDITVSIRRDGQFVTLTVTDQGVGIANDKLEAIFENFGQLDQSDTRRPGGAGLSLGISRSVVRQHGGRMWAESPSEGGSSFFVVLPVPYEQPLLDDVDSFRQLVENIRDVFWMVDVETRKAVYVSPAYEEVWGRSRESLYADPSSWQTAIHEADRAKVRDANEQQLLTPYRVEYRVVRPDGSEQWVRDRSYCVRNEFGDIVKLVGIAEDITEQHEADQALKTLNAELESRVSARTAEFRAIFESTPEAIVFTDPHRRIRIYNAAFARLYGYGPEEVVGQSGRIFYTSDEAYEEQGRIHFNPQPDEVAATFELTLKRKDGDEIPVELTVAHVVSVDGQFLGTLKMSRDLRPRRLVERQLQQARKMEAAGQLAGGIAHDFNNLLTVISGYTMMLLTDMELRDPRRELLTEIATASERAAALTGQLLTFSRRQIVRVETLDLVSVVEHSRPLLQRIVGEDVEVDVSSWPGSLSVRADRGQLEQILMNLAGNARDAMSGGGVLHLDTRSVALAKVMEAQPNPLPAGEYVVLTVSDTGTGMDQATRARMFEPFFSTKPPGEGTGLGLATVYGIVAEAGGGIVVETVVGQGTTFHIYLPRLTVDPAAVPDVSAGPVGQTVLVVEDEVMVRRLVRRVLEKQGYAVIEASDGQEGLDALKGTHRRVDLLVTDLIMPHMSGHELADKVRLSHPAVPVLFMSGYMDDKVARHGVEQEDVHFIRKPLVVPTFLQKVREVLQEATARVNMIQ